MVWNPFGGGLADTTTSCGGGGGGGGGGSGGFRKTSVVSMTRCLISSAAPFVAATAAKITTPWMITDRID